ncbi:ASCH domain protein [compost metagenome]|jgi:uncharacterized protein YhfF|uniref:ASCH domain-containing protein n=1 Tax=Silvania hatchlandensis TaxID=2926469 RepID=A0A9J6Q0B4_9ENTR|nr:ASCH domain-containing protein [Silvania hatchlandensis]MCU6664268.1 ASCH domain-containing protein [Silvania hatchlandensis]
MEAVENLKAKYPGAQAWGFGDSAEMADELAALVIKGIKTASCGSLAAFQAEDPSPQIGSYHIILDGKNVPVCVIRIVSMRLLRFCDVTEEFAHKEGEGDLSLQYWQNEHQAFFTRAGFFSEEMELVAEEFAVVEVLNPA